VVEVRNDLGVDSKARVVGKVEGGSCCVGSGTDSNTWRDCNGSVSEVGFDAEEKNASSGRGWMIRGREGGWLRKK
jgi:hypothetical protein